MARCNKHGQCFFFFFLGSHKGNGAGVLFIIALGLQRVQSGSEVGFTRVEGEACFHLVQDTFFVRAMGCGKAEGIRITEAVGSCGGNQGGLPLVPDVLERQHGREGPYDQGLFENHH